MMSTKNAAGKDGFESAAPQDAAARLALIDAQMKTLAEERSALLAELEFAHDRKRLPCAWTNPKPVVVIGGRGGMGRMLIDHLERSGVEARSLGSRDWLRAEEIMKGAGIVVVSVPIDVTEKVIEDAARRMPEDALLCDVTSVKAGPVAAMLKHHRGPVAGFHPMFGPDVRSFEKQVFVYTPGRMSEAAAPFVEQIRTWGARIAECTPEAHDRAMAIIQALRHFTTYAYGVFLAKERPDIRSILELSSPIYRLELEMVGRLFAQDPALYCDIIMASQEKLDLIARYVESLGPELEIVAKKDRDAFIKRFLKTREYFGDWAQIFLKESGAMLAEIQKQR